MSCRAATSPQNSSNVPYHIFYKSQELDWREEHHCHKTSSLFLFQRTLSKHLNSESPKGVQLGWDLLEQGCSHGVNIGGGPIRLGSVVNPTPQHTHKHRHKQPNIHTQTKSEFPETLKNIKIHWQLGWMLIPYCSKHASIVFHQHQRRLMLYVDEHACEHHFQSLGECMKNELSR